MERRVVDLEPPAECKERRVNPERRRPVVGYLDFDDNIEILPFDADVAACR